MAYSIIGTAGHVDHGKSTLIKALTGIQTDRLGEEKKRGITIDLGFAWLDTPDGEKIGIVDVPGHEKFVGNMLAGAGGIDLVLLIVAADEGVMPQTREHLDILQLLDVKDGVIVLTKADMVDDDWLELVKEDVRESVAHTFLKEAPLFAVDSVSGRGIEELRAHIFEEIRRISGKNEALPFRMPIDRVFTMEGFGTVVTGTIWEGKLDVDSEVMIYPAERTARVRSIQIHSEPHKTAYAGQRTAINLAGIAKDEIDRGATLAAPDSMDINTNIDVRIEVLPDSQFPIETGDEVHLHIGAGETLARVRLFEEKRIEAGMTAYARLRCRDPLAVRRGDPFVVRFFSPVVTIGGGHVLDPNPLAGHGRSRDLQSQAEILDTAPPIEQFHTLISRAGAKLPDTKSVFRRIGVTDPAERDRILDELLTAKRIYPLGGDYLISDDFLEASAERTREILNTFYRENPLKYGMRREELRSRLLTDVDVKRSDRLIVHLIEHGVLEDKNGVLALPGRVIERTPKQIAAQDKLMALYGEHGYAPPDTSDVIADLAPEFSEHEARALLDDLIDTGRLVHLTPQILITGEKFDEAVTKIRETIAANGSIKLGDFRDMIDTSRKFAVAILEETDRRKITKMQGDERVLGKA